LLFLSAAMLAAFVVGGCNSVNLIDGLDGLAAGTTAIGMFGLLFISVFAAAVYLPQSDPALLTDTVRMASAVRIVLCLATLGAVLGFLPFNFNPAVIFMGDAGSLLLGYLSAATILQFSLVPGKGPLMVMAGLIIFALPIADASLAVVRRKLMGRPIFSADNKHLHHRLLESGLSVKRAVLNLYVGAACLSVLGAALVMLRWRYALAVFVVVFGFIGVQVYKTAQRIMTQQRNQITDPPPSA
jgi:UDP-GlcNAc:undecaprenyl-phosphate GlcNAc-1-phosphate transferase